jgi:propionyl-CoA synthetase
MFTAPTAIRVLKKQDPKYLRESDLSSLRALFLAGEPLDEPTASWIAEALGKPIIDNYWQTESGWPILTVANGIEPTPSKFGSPGVPMYGYDVKLIDETTGQDIVEPNRKGVVVIEGRRRPASCRPCGATTPASCGPTGTASRAARLQHVRLGHPRCRRLLLHPRPHRRRHQRRRPPTRHARDRGEHLEPSERRRGRGRRRRRCVEGAGRDGVRRRQGSSALGDANGRLKLEGDIMKTVDMRLGALARPARVHFVNMLPKTRSGKLLRRAIQAVCEGRDTGDLTTIEDPAALQALREVVQG